MNNNLTLLNNEELEFINEVTKILTGFKEIKSISIIGSLAKGLYTDNSDIDILILVDMPVFKLEKCSVFVDAIKKDVPLKDDAYDLLLNGRNYSLLFKDGNLFLNNIKMILESKKLDFIFKPWAFGGMIEDVLLLDIKNQIIIYDKDGRLVDYSKTLALGYPISLANSIMEYSEEYIKVRIKAINRFYDNCLMSEILKSELLIGFVRYMYAKRRLFNPGLKHIYSEENIKKLQTSIPELITVLDYKNDLKQLAEYIESQISGGDNK